MSHLPLTTSYWPADFSSPVLGTTVGVVLRAAAAHAPDQVALVSGDPDPASAQLAADGPRAAVTRPGTLLLRPAERATSIQST